MRWPTKAAVSFPHEEVNIMTYQVKLTVFEGPLDLLLQLIERRELDITTVSLAQVTDQYVEHIRLLENVEPDVLTDFLVVAAKLILIKSQALLPRPPVIAEEEENAGDDLVRQLEEYRRFKVVAALLKERDEKGLHSYIRLATSGITPRLQLEGVVIDDLVEAMRRVLTTLPDEASAPEVARRQFTLEEKVALIEESLKAGRFSFHRLLASATTRIEAIITFLALLEMVKRGSVVVEQSGVFAEIMVGPVVANGAASATPDLLPE
jgi:segregation and condensation protein A